MPALQISILSPEDIQRIQTASLDILDRVGMVIHHAGVLEKLADAGARVDFDSRRVCFPPDLVNWALQQVGKRYILHGRTPNQIARFGYGDHNLISSPGQYAWFDWQTGERRAPVLADTRQAIRVADALPNITIAGAMTVPVDAPEPYRDLLTTAEMVRHTGKPTRCWPVSRQSSRYVLEIYALLAGGKDALRREPMVETFLEPISPLQLPEAGLDILLEYLEYGQPAAVGPMVMASGTGPATLAGTLVQENAEILGGITVIQVLQPGTPVTYGGIPHIMDPRTSICSFGSPEQGLMAAAMVQLGKSYGLPVYVNVNLSDAKLLDAQAGMEKMGSLMLGVASGADLFGHAGILGTDHGGSLPWLVVDNEALAYARRAAGGFTLDDESLAAAVIAETGPGGNYLAHDHTLRHFRRELWVPSRLWTRDSFDGWAQKGCRSMADRAAERVAEILTKHTVTPIDPAVEAEIERIVQAGIRELGG